MPQADKIETALIIGGTGMLADASRWLMMNTGSTLLAARRASQFNTHGLPIKAVDVDWGVSDFEAKMRSAIADVGPITKALLWIHNPDPVLPWLLPLLSEARVVLVLGSTDGRPQVPNEAIEIVTVRLGSISTAGRSRWLTHEEISAGAIAALQTGESSIIGELKN